MANSEGFEEALQTMVVNCFQISNFVLWQTADGEFDSCDTKL